MLLIHFVWFDTTYYVYLTIPVHLNKWYWNYPNNSHIYVCTFEQPPHQLTFIANSVSCRFINTFVFSSAFLFRPTSASSFCIASLWAFVCSSKCFLVSSNTFILRASSIVLFKASFVWFSLFSYSSWTLSFSVFRLI